MGRRALVHFTYADVLAFGWSLSLAEEVRSSFLLVLLFLLMTCSPLGQERNIRSGTLPSQLIVGLGAACEVASQEMERDAKHVKRLWDKLWNGLSSVRDRVSACMTLTDTLC